MIRNSRENQLYIDLILQSKKCDLFLPDAPFIAKDGE